MNPIFALGLLLAAAGMGLLWWLVLGGAASGRRQVLANLNRDIQATDTAAQGEQAQSELAEALRRRTPPALVKNLNKLWAAAGRPDAWPVDRVLSTKFLLGVAGMGLAVTSQPGLLQLLRFAGAAFLAAYGALAAARAWRGESGLQPADDAARDRWRVVLACLGFTLLNPLVYLDTVVLLGSLSTRYDGHGRWAFAGGACSASALWFAALGYGARGLLPVFRSPRAWRVFDLLVAVFMLTLAALLVLPSVR